MRILFSFVMCTFLGSGVFSAETARKPASGNFYCSEVPYNSPDRTDNIEKFIISRCDTSKPFSTYLYTFPANSGVTPAGYVTICCTVK